jgi:transcriptional regulator with XRE-family HTH domain
LRDARRDRGLTLRQVEERTGLNRAVLSQLENGLRAPTGRQIQLIANALDVRVSRVVVRVYLAIEEPAVR